MSTSEADVLPKLLEVDFDPFAGPELARTCPSTEAQREIWTAAQMGDDASAAFNESVSLTFDGDFDAEAFTAAIQELVARHEALRTTFSTDGITLCIAARVEIAVPLIDLWISTNGSATPAFAPSSRGRYSCLSGSSTGRSLAPRSCGLDERRHLAIVTAHHIVCDGWSMAVMLRDFAGLYSAKEEDQGRAARRDRFQRLRRGRARFEATSEYVASERYWREKFSGSLPVLELPTDGARPPAKTYASIREDFLLEPSLIERVKKVGAKNGASFFRPCWRRSTRCSGAFRVKRTSWSASRPRAVGHRPARARGALREHAAAARPGGRGGAPFRLSCAPCARRCSTPTSTSASPSAASSRSSRCRGEYQPPTARVRALQRQSSGEPGSTLNSTGSSRPTGRPRAASRSSRSSSTRPRPRAAWCSSASSIPTSSIRRTIRRWLSAYEELLRGMGGRRFAPARGDPHPSGGRAGQARLRMERDLHRVPAGHRGPSPFRGAGQELAPGHGCGVRGPANHLSASSTRAPTAWPVGCAGWGSKRGVLVGLSVAQSIDMVVGLLGVLKAGGAYVPLDPAFPKERLAFMVADSRMPVLIAQTGLAADLGPARCARPPFGRRAGCDRRGEHRSARAE